MGKMHEMPEVAMAYYGSGLLGDARRAWISQEKWSVEMFGREEAASVNEDLELWRKMPGWFAVGQDADDALLCVEAKTGRCAMVEVDDLRKGSAQEIAPSLEELLAQGRWVQ